MIIAYYELWIYEGNICHGRHCFKTLKATAEYLIRFDHMRFRFEINPIKTVINED